MLGQFSAELLTLYSDADLLATVKVVLRVGRALTIFKIFIFVSHQLLARIRQFWWSL
jgi:hypothetical protein